MSDDHEYEFGAPDGPNQNELFGLALVLGGLSGMIVGAIITLILVAIF